jgi:transcriptional regulator with XRE-family HTH domain
MKKDRSATDSVMVRIWNGSQEMHMTPEKIKSLRKDKGLTQEQLATMMQVDSTTIYRWENGIVTPSLVKMAILKDILIKPGDGRIHPFVTHLLSRSQATAILDFHGVYFKLNTAYEDVLGYGRTDLLGHRAWDILEHLAKTISDQSSVDLEKFVQGKIACVRVENLKNPKTGERLDHELHVVAQKEFSTIIVHETKPSKADKTWTLVTVDPKF